MANIEKRVSKKGVVSYMAKVRLKGFQFKTKTFSHELDDLKWATEYERNLKNKREIEDLDSDTDDIAQIVLRVPKKLAEEIKTVASRGHRSQFIIKILEDHFSKKEEKQKHFNKRYAAVKQIPNLYPAFTIGGIRYLIFNKEEKGFANCVKKIGKKIVIDLDNFEKWIESN